MRWISISKEGWTGAWIVIRSYLGETRRYQGCSVRDAERAYRSEFGLTHIPLARIND